MVHPGYYQARTFYQPNYREQPNIKVPDYRTTLYWDPMVNNADGPAEFSCFTGDLAGEYQIQIEGITNDGVPFVSSKSFWVRE